MIYNGRDIEWHTLRSALTLYRASVHKEGYLYMHTHRRIWQYFQQHRLARIALGYGCVALTLITSFAIGGLGGSAFAQSSSSCTSGDQTYTVVGGDTLSGIAANHQVDWHNLATYNHIDRPNLIYSGQVICIPTSTNKSPGQVSAGKYNPYPYGQCTWWADQRYHTLHGVYIPWLFHADAWQWTTRARQHGWHVSKSPTVGSILNLQPWVQGAYGYGHVAVVERILKNGHVIASNMNWAGHGSHVVNTEFSPGAGVTFITT